jgi:two-component system phosphate regulon sensor histidine kinase PhoR
MKASLLFKTFIVFTFIIVILSAVILTVSFSTIQNNYTDLLEQELKNNAFTLSQSYSPLLEAGNLDTLKTLVDETGQTIGKRITIIDTEGVVLADSAKDPLTMENHRNRPEIQTALRGETGKSLRYSSTMEADMLYVAIPIENGMEIEWVLRLSLYMKDIEELINTFKSKIYTITIAITVILLIGAFVFANRITGPIRQLQDASRRISQGDLEAKVFLKQKGDIRDLADSYNYMTDELSKNITERTKQEEELRSIISSMQSGLFVLDRRGRIVLSNTSTERIVQKRNIIGSFYWTVVKNIDLFELIQKVQNEKVNMGQEIELLGHHYHCNAAYLPTMDEIVIVMHDITGMKNLQRIKRDFVSNVSHEMRTPLTAIKGYAETIDGLSDDNKEYLNIIKRHTDRLINIVQDLMILSEMEEIGMKLDMDTIDINATLTNIMKIFRQRIDNKGLAFQFNLDNAIQPIRGDHLKLEQAFINLIDNAVKYTEEGGITISSRIIEGFVVIEIKDTGIGIPEKHMPRIFERFYTVDKSHSRKLGGTGLGLSIVKHIVLLHNGAIDVESQPERGTKFRIDLPLGS